MAQQLLYPIKIEIDRLQSTASGVRVSAGEYRRYARQLIREATSVPKWRGADAAAFRAQLKGFEDDMETMAALMETYAAFLEASAKQYRSLQDSMVAQARALWNW